jgi:hypothetical protein
MNAYSAGKHSSFDGLEVYLIACCGMTRIASMEPIQHANSKTLASGVMKIQVYYGFCHKIVLDKDSNFLGSAVKCLTSFKSIAMFSQATTITNDGQKN